MRSAELKILFVEDSSDDALMVEQAFSKSGVPAHFERVETSAGMREALQQGEWDAVVSDFSLPGFDAFDALKLVQASGLDLPFIVVSGTVGEDVAVEAMRRGAHDYVMKSSLTRLPPAVLREIREAQVRHERRTLEGQLRQAQKMEAVAQLAGGLTHDFNNLLTVIMSNAQFVHDELPEDHLGRPDLVDVVECASRAACLTRQLVAFSRKSIYDPDLLDLGALLEGAQKTLARLVGPRVDLKVLRPSGPVWCVADRGLIEQVVVNLVMNAGDAMPEGGKLTVEAGLSGDDQVLLAVTDTGTGLSQEAQAHLFEPFFTTKPAGLGTGLGLSTVQSIVHQAGGVASAHSDGARGTTFLIRMPRAWPTDDQRPPALAATSVFGTETVLIVEDQADVRATVHRALKSKGYRVLDSSRPHDALKAIDGSSGPLDLVLTDIMLPEMSGPQLVGVLRAQRPGLGVLYMSGYASGALAHQGLVDPGAMFLQKPFTPHSLAVKVRAALDARQSTVG